MKTLLLIAALTATLPAYADEYGRLQAEINQMRAQQYQMESQQAIQRNQQNNLQSQQYQQQQQQQRLIYPDYPPAVQERYGREYEIMPGQAPGQDSYQYQLRD